LSRSETRLKQCLLAQAAAVLYADRVRTKGGEREMRFLPKKRLFHKRTPEQIERAYRQMLAEQETERKTTHWFALRFGWPML
jgi:hypothetical protein